MRLFTLALGLLALTLAVPVAHAQRPGGPPQLTGTISGTVVEAGNGTTIPSASVAIYSAADSTFLTGTITNPDGTFTLERLRPNTYYVRVSFVGFESQTFWDLQISRENRAIDLGRVEMAEGALLVEGVSVEAERSFVEVGIDRTSYNTSDQIVGQVGTATDLLQQIPSVEVDQDGGISLRGNANVAIQINGRPAPVSGAFLGVFLQQLPAAQIERIEVIPNPSARYEPDGMSGIINIVLKQDAELGLSGSVIAGGGTLGDANASASLNYGKGKWNATASYGLRRDARPSSGESLRETFSTAQLLNQDSDNERTGLSHLFNSNVDYKLTPRQTLTGSAVLSLRDRQSEGFEITNILSTVNQTTLEQFNRLQDEEGDGLSVDFRGGYDYVVESGRDELRTELRYNRSDSEETERYDRVFTTAVAQGQDPTFLLAEQEEEQEVALRIDRILPFGDEGKVEVGYQGTYETTDQSQFSDSLGTSFQRADAFGLDEQVHAAYAIYGTTLGKWAAQGGVRAEYENIDYTFSQGAETLGSDREQLDFFPSAFVTFAPTETQQLKASYSRRVNRPRGRQLNPFPSLDDPLNIRVGNPDLQPEYTDAYELGYSRFSNTGTFTLTPFYRRTTGVVRRIVDFNEVTGVRRLTFANLATEESYGVEVIATRRVLGRGNVLLSLNGNRQVSDGTANGDEVGADAFTWGARMSLNLPLRPGLDLQGFGFYRAPYDTEFGRISAFSMSNLSLRQRFMDNRLSVSLNLGDVFNSSGFSFNIAEQGVYRQEASRRWSERNLSFSVTYAFGDQSNQRRQRGRPDGGERGGDDEGGMF
jgi:outer membrane receptor protein involved in Fe transport